MATNRTLTIQAAEIEIETAISKVGKTHGLTFPELVAILARVLGYYATSGPR
jgi:hypothetical protein